MSASKKIDPRPRSVQFSNKVTRILIRNNSVKTPRTSSLGAIEELVQCGICLEKLVDPRMLPCQHTFCLNCLQTHLVAKNIKPANTSENNTVQKYVNCPLCQKKIVLENGLNSLEDLPKNFYIDSLMAFLNDSGSPTPNQDHEKKCTKCKIVSSGERLCHHCKQMFCNICWNEHISELKSNLIILVKQLEESENRLRHKAENFSDRCDHLSDNVKRAIQLKIDELKNKESLVLGDLENVKKGGDTIYHQIDCRIHNLKETLASESLGENQVTTFMNLHRETSKLLDEVHHYGEARLIFDPETLKLDQDTEGIYNDISDKEDVTYGRGDDPFESEDNMKMHYKTRSFTPKLLWNKCPRPAGVGIPPWDSTKLYITATDTHNILILDRNKIKVVGRINHPEMICPCSIAFLENTIFVADKWKHCIHVFTSEGDYVKSLCEKRVRSPEGIAINSKNQLIICDTGNNRVLIVNPETGELVSTIGMIKGKTELNMPSGVAVFGETVVVADSGNYRIKTFNSKGEKMLEFGSLGRNQGQFRSAEVVAIDPMGFILVGDAGNARVQVFKPDGTLVKIFGSKEGFRWVSGIYVTPELEIITTDIKTRSLRIF